MKRRGKILWPVVGLGSAIGLVVTVFQPTANWPARKVNGRPAVGSPSKPKPLRVSRLSFAGDSSGRHRIVSEQDRRFLTAVSTKPDFAAAMNLASRSMNESERQRTLLEVGYRWVEFEPAKALVFMQNLSPSDLPVLMALANQWARREPRASATWALGLPADTTRERLPASLSAVWAESSPVEAAQFVSGLPPGNARDQAVLSVSFGWAQRDPRAALEWAGSFPPGKLEEQVYSQALYAWSECDLVSAAEWLLSQPDGQTWDLAASVVSGAMLSRQPMLALELAATIGDEGIRKLRLENVAHRWLAADRAAAENALIDSDFPASAVAGLIQ